MQDLLPTHFQFIENFNSVLDIFPQSFLMLPSAEKPFRFLHNHFPRIPRATFFQTKTEYNICQSTHLFETLKMLVLFPETLFQIHLNNVENTLWLNNITKKVIS